MSVLIFSRFMSKIMCIFAFYFFFYMENIKNIIFDFGGVIYNVRYENMFESMRQYGVQGLESFYTKSFQTHEMDLFETGLMSTPDFRNYLREATHLDINDEQVDGILNSMLLGLPKERVDLLLDLRQKYRLVLFSNTNEVHCKYFTEEMIREYGYNVIDECFEAVYYSHTMHQRKPFVEGFLQIIREQHLVPEETLFIDDNEYNVAGACKAGLVGRHLDKGTILDLFDDGLNYKG